MSTVEASMTSFGGNTFWGLVQQKGPWQTTKSDKDRATQSKPNYGGGGTGAGGTGHAGNGNWLQVMTPNQLNGSAAPLKPSDYAMRSVMMSPVDMKKQTKMGRVKSKLTLGARTPFQTGHKMAMIHEEIRFDQAGQPKGDVPLYQESFYTSEMKQEQVPTFVPPPPNPDQLKASEIARDNERKAVMDKRRGSFQLGPESSKRQQKGFGEVGFKRKEQGKEEDVEKKKPRTMFQGPLKASEAPNKGSKRKAEMQIMSEKYKKLDTKKVTRRPKLKIRTQDVGKRFIERKVEPKSRAKRFDQLPEIRTRHQLLRAQLARRSAS